MLWGETEARKYCDAHHDMNGTYAMNGTYKGAGIGIFSPFVAAKIFPR